jgi:glc operon protein GlcG
MDSDREGSCTAWSTNSFLIMDAPRGAEGEQSVMDSWLGLTEARQIVEMTLEDASRLGLRISVAVADEAGALLAFARMDGATRLSARTAVDKTQTVILTGKATLDLGREWRAELAEEPELFHGMIARPDVVPFGGGVPVRVNGRLAGAVAVSGATSVQDHEIASRAASAVADR